MHQHICQQVLKDFGWEPLSRPAGCAIARKTYDTAVGPKTAHAYFSDIAGDPWQCALRGDYLSEGSNILEAGGVLLPRSASEDDVRRLSAEFALEADARVSRSYAVRLLRFDLQASP